jgi:vacuolar-type H+-ATPase subunit H
MAATPKTSGPSDRADATDRLTDTLRDGARRAKETMSAVEADMRDTVDAAKDAATETLDEGRSRVERLVRKAQDTAASAKDAILADATATMASVRDVAIEKADAARDTLSEVGQRLAATLERAASEGTADKEGKEDKGDALKTRLATSVAQGLSAASDALRERSVTDLSSDVRTLARRYPGAFMAAAALAGFAAARFVRASSRRRAAHLDDDLGAGRRL